MVGVALTVNETKAALLLAEEVNQAMVARVTLEGYGNLDENGIEQVGRDPFLSKRDGVALRGEA